jgi:hypothetical protein
MLNDILLPGSGDRDRTKHRVDVGWRYGGRIAGKYESVRIDRK